VAVKVDNIEVKKFYIKSIGFWGVLLVVALINATIRETTYKPLLTPYIGMWAHQLSSITGILLFYAAIYFFLKRQKGNYQKKDLPKIGGIWIGMTLIFECWMNVAVRHLSWQQVLETYYFWKGDTWIFVLLSLTVSPLIANRQLRKE
jgi:hypothetical protein